jgi:diguanylate cyclase (GGDEF)-like protein
LEKKKKLNSTVWIVLMVSLLLLGFTSIFGALMIWRSQTAIGELLHDRMLDVSNAAAAVLDGDVLGNLTAEDADTPEYQSCLATLRAFQESIDLNYIYGIKQLDDGSFVFSIDPDPEDPAEFGSPFTAETAALRGASLGVPGADDVALEDEWGRAYSSYSPVFGSDGTVKGIVGVDFDADWVDEQIAAQTRIILISSLVSLVMGVLITLMITDRYRRRLAELSREMGVISEDAESLMQDIRLPEELRPDTATLAEEEVSDDQLTAIKQRLDISRRNLRRYISYLHSLSYTDVLTGIGNRNSYTGRVKELDAEIKKGCAAFSLIILDVNSLKAINDTYGHDEGDRVLVAAGRALRSRFGAERVYRIGGDEFAALPDCADPAQMPELVEQLQAAVAWENSNAGPEAKARLEVSCGTAVYAPGVDSSFADVFRRADQLMYQEKAAYYATHGDRRKAYT